MRPALLTLLTATTLTLGACGDPDPNPDVSSTPPAASTPAPIETTPVASTPAEEPATDEVKVEKGKCADVPAATPKSPDAPEPSGKLPTDVRNILTLKTSCGTIKIELDAKGNPKTANSVGALAKAGYYDGLAFHRTVEDFMIQGGDPAGNGSGGPSWKVVEAPASDTKYTEGVVAMAKTATEAPGTSGSQFFIVTGAAAATLPPEYAVAGKVVKGQDVAKLISEQGTEGADGPPNKPVVIFSAKLTTK